MSEEEGAPRRWLRVREITPWSEALAEAICGRVARGELLHAICREAGMPTHQTVGRWAKQRAAFGEALEAARRAGGRSAAGGGVWGYCRETAEAICERLCEGESLTAICRDPTMPSLSAVYRWAARFAEFAEMLRQARQIQADRYCDRGWELAMQATPETAYLTDVRLKQLRWMAGCLAPRTYRPKMVEPPHQEVQTILLRTFGVKVNPETGERKVVSYTPNPETLQVECDDAAGTQGWEEEPPAPPHPGTAWGRGERDW